MGRYLERTSHLCSLLRLQVEALVDRPIPEIHFGWRRIYASVDRRPPFGGDFEPDESDDFTLADSYTLAGDLTFERSNLDSVRSCFALGRGERPPDAPLHQRGDVDLPESCLAAHPRTRRRGHLEGLPGKLLRRDDPRDRHLHRRGRSDHVPGRGLALHAARTVHRARPAPGCAAPRPARYRPDPGRGHRHRLGRVCCAHARPSTPTSEATASRSGRIGCWTFSSPIPCCPARCTVRSIRWRRSLPPSARAPSSRTRSRGRAARRTAARPDPP